MSTIPINHIDSIKTRVNSINISLCKTFKNKKSQSVKWLLMEFNVINTRLLTYFIH